MKRVLMLVVLVIFATLPAAAQAQGGAAPATGPVSTMLKGSFDTISRYITASAEKMPEENYAFKPTPEVMSFGQLLTHVAATHFSYCSRVKGEANPNAGGDIEKKTAKADIVKAFADSVAYCAPLYAMSDAAALEALPAPLAPQGQQAAPPPPPAPPRPPAQPQAKLQRLLGNVTHDWEHYGNLVTYLRIKGLVPPSSEPRR